MARIPDVTALGERPIPQPGRPQVIDQSGEILGQALYRTGETLDRINTDRVNLARAKASNDLLDHQIAVESKVEDFNQRIASGEIDYNTARQKFDEEVQKLPQPQVQGLDTEGKLTLERGITRNAAMAGFKIDHAVDVARKQDFQDQFAGSLDRLGKLAGMPGADVEKINRDAESFVPLAMRSGLPKNIVDKAIQDFKDRNWLNQATQRAMESKDNMSSLKALEHDLTATNGFYAGKLDTDKRNAVLSSVINSRLVLQNRIEHEQDRRDAKAERVLNQIDQQIASGVPATAGMWTQWESQVRGTPAADEFKQRLKDEEQVQGVLRQPIGDQLKFVQEKEAKLDSEGGTIRDRANLGRLKSAVQANVKLLQESPLLFNANRTGTNIAPLDLTAMGDPTRTKEVSDQIGARMASLTAMRKEYGAQIPLRPLLPQEASQLVSVLDKSTPQQQAGIFAALDRSIGDVQAFQGVMQQIAPDAPVKALAGMLASKQSKITLDNHWFKPDEIATSGDVATTLLQGEQLLNATKGQKAEDGKPKTGLYLPEDTSLQDRFQEYVGSAFAGRPGAAQVAFQAVKAYYAGKASQTGRLAANKLDIDSGLMKEAITATLGKVVDFNGQGQVLAPWGMDESTFNDQARSAWIQKAKSLGMPEHLPEIGLRNQGDGTYYVVQGKNFLYDKNGRPVVLNVTQ